MTRFSKYYSILLILIVLQLSIVAIDTAYSHWRKRLNISGTISTGDLDIVFSDMCIGYLYCGCHGNYEYEWGQYKVDINIFDYPSHYAVLVVLKITNQGSVEGSLSSIYLVSDLDIGSNIGVYGMFFYHEDELCIDPGSYPIKFTNGWNNINPKVNLEPGQTIYLALIYLFDLDCNSNIDGSHIILYLPWSMDTCSLGGWVNNQYINITFT